MAIYHEIFEFRESSHRCEKDPDDKDLLPLSECYACKQEAGRVELDGKTYVNSYPDSRVELGSNGRAYAVTHEGLTLADRERNYYDDSDFYAVVWDPESKRVHSVDYATTRFGGTDHNYVKIDFDDKYKPDLREFYIQQTIAGLEDKEREDWRDAARDAISPRKGATLTVISGRKVPVGTVGLCIWAGESRWGERVGLVPDGAKEPVWTSIDNVKVVIEDYDLLPYQDDFTSTPAQRRERAESIVDARMDSFHRGVRVLG